jgi:hypothetical protein
MKVISHSDRTRILLKALQETNQTGNPPNIIYDDDDQRLIEVSNRRAEYSPITCQVHAQLTTMPEEEINIVSTYTNFVDINKPTTETQTINISGDDLISIALAYCEWLHKSEETE